MNVVDIERYPRLDIEAVAGAKPELILQARMDLSAGDAHDEDAFWKRWPSIPAVAAGRVVVLPDDLTLRPGPRVGAAVEELAAILHREDRKPGRAMSLFATPGRRATGLLVVAACVVVAAAIAAGVGSSDLTLRDVLTTLMGGGDAATRGIVIDFRLARVLLAACVGAALAAAGTSYQAVLRNPLADPFILGVSGGAALGAVIFIAIAPSSGLGDSIARPAAAFAGAVVTLIVLFGLARFQGRTETTALLLTGVVLNALDSAVIQFFVSAGDPARFQGTLSYLMGAMNAPSWQTLAIVATLTAIGIAVLLSQAHTLNLLSLGDEEAAQLGVPVDRATWTIVLAASLVTAAAVAFTGIIGFVGLIVPHAMRALFGPDHRILIPASALGGAATLMLADAAARTFIAPAELPVGVVTALIGGPFFLTLLMKRLRAS